MNNPADDLRARANQMEGQVPPLIAGPRTEHERLLLGKAAELREEADRLDQAANETTR